MRLTSSTLHICIAVAFCLHFFSPLTAQTDRSDTIQTDSSFLGVFSEQNFMHDTLVLNKPTEFHFTQRYQIQSDYFPYLRVGNPGHALYSPLLNNMTSPVDLSSSVQRPYLPYMDQRSNINYYRNAPPFTVLSYMSGARKEESIDVSHARNIGKNMNLALHLNRNGSLGFYNHLKTRSAHFNISFNYATANNRYNLLTHYYVNRKELQENGGFKDFNSVENPETIGSSYLSSASNEIKEEGIFLSQSIGFGNIAKNKDDLIRPVVRFGYDVQYFRGSKKYYDPGDNGILNSEFYSNIYFDSTIFRDTISYDNLKNQVNIFLYPGKERIKFYYLNELISYKQSQFVDTIYNDHSVGSEFSLFLFKQSYRSDIQASYVFKGFREGELMTQLNLKKRKIDTLNRPSVLTTFFYNLYQPQFKHLRYQSNEFIWTNNFKLAQHVRLKIGVDYKGYNLYADGGIISNYIYFNNEGVPDQNLDRITYSAVGLNKLLSWRNIHLDNRIIYQNSSSKALPIPTLMLQEGLYYENLIFNKVLLYRIGVDVNYFTGFNGLAYSPVVGEFHTQNQTIIGNYPFVDLYLSFQLKRAFFFLKFEHFNKGMSGDNFYQIPNYPVPPRAFKWGLKWTMYD